MWLCWNEGGRTCRGFSFPLPLFAVTDFVNLFVSMPYAESQEVRAHKSEMWTLADQYVWRWLVKRLPLYSRKNG